MVSIDYGLTRQNSRRLSREGGPVHGRQGVQLGHAAGLVALGERVRLDRGPENKGGRLKLEFN